MGARQLILDAGLEWNIRLSPKFLKHRDQGTQSARDSLRLNDIKMRD